MTISSVAALREAIGVIETKVGTRGAPLGVVLGSGLGGLTAEISNPTRIEYGEIPHVASSSVEGHAGELVVGTWQGHDVFMLSGRIHRYEGHGFARIALLVQLLAAMGAETLIITNAAGAANPKFSVGDLMLLTDHINLMGDNPLIGPNDERLGPRFPDMTEAYDIGLRSLARTTAEALDIELHEGVYAGVLGPSYETPAEVKMLRMLGADAIGMSTVPEVIAARHAGMRVLGLSCLTNMAAGMGNETLDHSHVSAVAAASTEKMIRVIAAIVEALPPLKVRKDYAESIRSSRS